MNVTSILRHMSILAANRIKLLDVWRADQEAFLQLPDSNLHVTDYMYIVKNCNKESLNEHGRKFFFTTGFLKSCSFRGTRLLLYQYILYLAVVQWLRCCATNRKVAGSIPRGVSGFFIDIKSFWSQYGPRVDSASNRNEYQEYFLGVKAAGA